VPARLLTLSIGVIINMTRMINRKENHRNDARVAADELELDRERARDPLRPLVLVLIEQARRQIAEDKEREEGTREVPPAPRTGHERP